MLDESRRVDHIIVAVSTLQITLLELVLGYVVFEMSVLVRLVWTQRTRLLLLFGPGLVQRRLVLRVDDLVLNHGTSLAQIVVTIATLEEILHVRVVVHVALQVRRVRRLVRTLVALLLLVLQVNGLIQVPFGLGRSGVVAVVGRCFCFIGVARGRLIAACFVYIDFAVVVVLALLVIGYAGYVRGEEVAMLALDDLAFEGLARFGFLFASFVSL